MSEIAGAAAVPGTSVVREEDAFDVPAVAGWLATQVEGLGGPPDVLQFRGGVSNLTFLLRYPGGRDVVVRMPPRGHKAASAHDMHREFLVQQRLAPVYPLVPTVLAFCDDPSVCDRPFYAMARIEGLILRADLPTGMTLPPAEARRLSGEVVDRLADLHAVDLAAAGLDALGKGAGYVGRQVGGWSRRYRDARTPDVPDGERVMAWLAEQQPADSGTCLIHNDWRFDNLVLDGRLDVVGVLDWEMATVGDPLMDLGGALAYWVQADDEPPFQLFRRQPTHLPGMLTRSEVVERYSSRTGRDVGEWRFYEVFGLFRLAVIVVQVWYRYVQGQTTNPAFAGFGAATAYLLQRAERVAGL